MDVASIQSLQVQRITLPAWTRNEFRHDKLVAGGSKPKVALARVCKPVSLMGYSQLILEILLRLPYYRKYFSVPGYTKSMLMETIF